MASHFILFYDYVENIVERRTPYREEHLARAQEAKDDGRIVMAGALGDPPHSAALVFHVDDPSEVESFAAGDPYVVNGLVTSHRVEPWNVVI